LSMFPDCGHLPHVEHPERFAAVLSDWLTEHRDPPNTTPSTALADIELEEGERERSTMATPERRTA